MLNPQFSNGDQNEIKNASDRVVVVAARIALDEYLKYSAYICQPDRAFRDCVRIAFYTKNKIDRHVPKILGQIEAISRDEIERRTDLSDSDRARLRTLRDTMESARREDWSKRNTKFFFLQPPDYLVTLVLPVIFFKDLPLGVGLVLESQQEHHN